MPRLTYISFLAMFLLPGLGSGAELPGRVVRIVDGDTLVLLVEAADGQKTQEKIRLAGIDCPERKQAWGERARQALAGYVFSQDVTVKWDKRDRYHRVVGTVLDNEKDVNLAMVKDGMCWWYRKYAHEQSPADQTLYEAEEARAKAKHLGLWSDSNPTPPWEWRHR
jgi:endonuclease YncB( thermonuclease family)